jgi:hypothetical protein
LRAEAESLANDEGSDEALRNEHLRRELHHYRTHAAHALNIDSYAEQFSQANRAGRRFVIAQHPRGWTGANLSL